MDEHINFEISLLLGAISETKEPSHMQLMAGNYTECIHRECAKLFDSSDDTTFEDVDVLIAAKCEAVASLAEDSNQGSVDIFALAVSCLQLFVQNNWTGQVKEFDLFTCIPDTILQQNKDSLHTHVVSSLSVDGQTLYPLTKSPELLFFARQILGNIHSRFTHLPTLKWWWMRCLSVHQQVLDAKAASIKAALMETIESIGKDETLLNNSDSRILYHLEAGYICYDIFEYRKAKDHFLAAKEVSGLQVDLTGMMGKRTKFQENAKSQLVLQVSATNKEPKDLDSDRSRLPKNIALNDDTVLETLQLTEPTDVPHTPSPLESVLILGLMENHRRSQADYTIVQEEVSAYIAYLLSKPCVWCVEFVTLFRRCRMERTSGRRVERAMMQMEELTHCFTRATPSITDRLSHFYATRLPTSWMVQCELASLLKTIGATGAALNIYEKLHLWEEAIVCCQQLGKTHRAESMIREQLAIKESANLYCFLGDVTGKLENYEKAWELSGHRIAKAQRCMAYIFMNKQQFNKALECFERTLRINSLQIPVWFTYGCCAMAAEKFSLGVKAFSNCVSLDYDNFEAWSNLATCHVKLKQKEKAFRTLQDAIKCNYDNWQLWENCLIIGTDCGEFQSVINAYHRLLDLKDKWIDVQVLGILVRAIATDLPDSTGQPASRLLSKALQLFGRITSKTTGDADIWRLYAELNASLPSTSESLTKCVQYLHKSHRCLCQAKDWERDVEKCKQISRASIQLANASLDVSEVSEATQAIQHLSSAKLMLKNTTAKIKSIISSLDVGEVTEAAQAIQHLSSAKLMLKNTTAKIKSIISSLELSEVSEPTQAIQHLSSAKLMLKNTTAKIKMQQTNLETSEITAELRESFNTMTDLLEQIVNKIGDVKT